MFKKHLKLLSISAGFTLSLSSTALAGTWQQDGTRWKYQENDTTVTQTWISDQNKWYYFDETGYLKTGWLLDHGDWYYLDSFGVMTTNTIRTIDQVKYTFDESGKLIKNPRSEEGWEGNTYNNPKFNYSITLPDGYEQISAEEEPLAHFMVEKDGAIIAASHFPIEKGKNLASYIDELIAEAADYEFSIVQRNIYLGGYKFVKIHYSILGTDQMDVYCRQAGSDILCFSTYTPTGRQEEMTRIINSLQRID